MTTPNVLLIVLDSVRAKNTSLHGHVNDTTPFLESFAAEATKYDHAYSPGIHSTPSHVSMFTGHHVEEHRATDRNSSIDISSTIWRELSDDYGYNTGLFTANVPIAQASNLGESFDYLEGPREWSYLPFPDVLSPASVENINETSPFDYLKRALLEGTPIRSVANGAAELLGKEYNHRFVNERCTYYFDEFLGWADASSEPWAACINLMDAHFPYHPLPEYDKWGGKELQKTHRETLGPYSTTFLSEENWWKLQAFEALYDGAIHQIDQCLEQFISTLDESGILDDTLLVVTSDHGEGFGERSRIEPGVRLIDHSWGIDEELVHVPLLVSEPGQESGTVVDQPASLTEFPTVVRSALDESDTQSTFVPEGNVITTTYTPNRSFPDSCDNPDDYQGPWKAAYEVDDCIRKFATRQTTETTFEITDAQTLCHVGDSGRAELEAIYDREVDDSVQITGSARDVDSTMKKRLKDLGYV